MRAEAEKRRERFEFEMEQVTIDLKLAVKKSNRDIEQRDLPADPPDAD